MKATVTSTTRSQLLLALCTAGALTLSAPALAQTSQSDAAAANTSPGRAQSATEQPVRREIQRQVAGARADVPAANIPPESPITAPAEPETSFTSADAIPADDTDNAVDTTAAERTREVSRTEAVDRTGANNGALYFSEVDNSNDYRLSWDEIRTSYEQEVMEADWSQVEFFDEFDTDGDELLDEDEYSEFIAEIGLEEPANRSSFIHIE